MTGVIFCFGCLGQSENQDSKNDYPQSQPKDDRPLLITYSTRIPPGSLTADQKFRIIDTCTTQFPQEPIWFVYVRSNRDGYFLVNVYLMPSQTKGRVYQGHVAGLSNDLRLQEALTKALKRKYSGPAIQSSLGEYRYVAPRNRSLDRRTLPSGNELPFEVMGGVADDVLVDIVDFYRAGGTSYLPGTGNSFPFDKTKPILAIKQDQDGLRLQSGWNEGFLSG